MARKRSSVSNQTNAVTIDVDRQKATEFTRAQRKEYDSVYGEQLDKTLNKPEPEKSDKISHSGDI